MRPNDLRLGALALLLFSAAPLGCASAPDDIPWPEPPAAKAPAAPCARVAPGPEKPLDASGTSSTVALVRAGNRTLAYVADEDDGAVRTVDVDMRNELAVTPLGGVPSEILVLPDGRLAVSLRDKGRVQILEPPADAGQPLGKRCAIDVPPEPTGLAVTPDGATLFVASRWGHAVSAFAASDLSPLFTADLPRDPRSLVATADGKKLFVGHVAGSRVSVLDVEGDHRVRSIDLHDRQTRQIVTLDMGLTVREFTAAGKARTEKRDQRASLGFSLVRTAAGRILAPEAMVDTGNGVRSPGYGEARSAFGDVAALDPSAEKRLARPAFDGQPDDCLLPRGAAVDPDGQKLLVACRGLGAVVVYDASSPSPHAHEARRYGVGAGPTGVAVDGDFHRAVAWAQFDRRLSVIDLLRRKGQTVESVVLGGPSEALSASVARGRMLFHTTAGRRVAFDGRACASCHPDGRDDGLTWTTPDGPRQTPMLAGRLPGTAPYGWSGKSADLAEHLKHTFDRLAGKGLTPAERADLLAYVASLRVPAPEATADAALVARGDALFHGEEAGCASCHQGDVLTDCARHDVRSRAPGDIEASFDTPSLRFVGKSAPYYHDGRFPTLDALLRSTGGKMGPAAHLSDADRAALAAYLGSL
jgi:DNA-binding beta-propeller fold protein YncE/mono/diheme cytochrome c family protein